VAAAMPEHFRQQHPFAAVRNVDPRGGARFLLDPEGETAEAAHLAPHEAAGGGGAGQEPLVAERRLLRHEEHQRAVPAARFQPVSDFFQHERALAAARASRDETNRHVRVPPLPRWRPRSRARPSGAGRHPDGMTWPEKPGMNAKPKAGSPRPVIAAARPSYTVRKTVYEPALRRLRGAWPMESFFRQFLFPLSAGLAVFMAGMKTMEHALYAWTGEWMKTMLARLTRTPLRGLLTGTVAAAALQSSSAVTVLTVGMVSAGVLTFPRSLGIILGANIGTCLTTELIGLKMEDGAFFPALCACIAVHLAVRMPGSPLRKAPKLAAAGGGLFLAAAGFGGILLGIRIMQGIVPYLRDNGLFSWFLEHAGRSPLWGIAAGAALAAAIHSSSAAIAMAMGLSALGVLPVPLAIAIMLGCNVGTCVTALI